MCSLKAQTNCSACHPENAFPDFSNRGIFERAHGLMDRGRLSNITTNLGELSGFHATWSDALHWPREAPANRQYSFGLGLIVGVDENNVIETITQITSTVQDWLPSDDAEGNNYSGDLWFPYDYMPHLASSDLSTTWPFGYFDDFGQWIVTDDRIWPGQFRVNILDPGFPETWVEQEDEFSSDRDIFCTYSDYSNPNGSVGITVEQTAYSYGRPYAEDLLFWDFNLINTSDDNLDSVYVGLLTKFRPDFDNHDYLNFIDTDDDGLKDFVYVYDINNANDGVWSETDDPLGMVGLKIYDTPGEMGVTDFHHFSREASPDSDEEIWAIMISDDTSPALVDPNYYFHGDDTHIDDTSIDSLSYYYPEWTDNWEDPRPGAGINYIISAGPFDFNAYEEKNFSLGVIMGDAGSIPHFPDTTDLMLNLRMADRMYSLRFQEANPPIAPSVSVVPTDQAVTVSWTAEPSESSIDAMTGEQDFEGYKIYRSTDAGLTWGIEVSDVDGNLLGYEPIAIFDLDNEVAGPDPVYPQSLGNNSGLEYSFTDSDLINDFEYWYCVTAFDQGNQEPDNLLQSFQSPLGTSDIEAHTIKAIPSINYSNGDTLVPIGSLNPNGGPCAGVVKVDLVDPEAITGNVYELTFDSQAILPIIGNDSIRGLTFTLVDTTLMDTIFSNHMIPDTSEVLPATDGFRLSLDMGHAEIINMGWTTVSGDTSTFDWRTTSKYPELVPSGQAVGENIKSFEDFKIVVDYAAGTDVLWYDVFFGGFSPGTQHIPLRVYSITDQANPVDISVFTWLAEFNHSLSDPDIRSMYYSPLGWDLEPGGQGYLSGSPGWFEKHVDFLVLNIPELYPGDPNDNYLYLFTDNKPDSSYNRYNELEIIDAIAPSHGDEFTIVTSKSFRTGISYIINTQQATPSSADQSDRYSPDRFILHQNYPNPFNPVTTIRYSLPVNSNISVTVYDIRGRQIRTLVNQQQLAGVHSAIWDGTDDQGEIQGSGLYLCQFQAGDFAKSIKMLFLR